MVLADTLIKLNTLYLLAKRGILILHDTTKWCRRRDSNSHDLSHNHLKVACLPIPPRRHFFRANLRC